MDTSTTKSFKSNLSTINKSGETVRVAVQNACIQAVGHYAKTSDTGYLTQLMNVSKANRGIRTKTLQGFIQEHANVKYSKIKDSQGNEMFVFKKASGKNGEVVTSEIDTQWFDFDKQGEAAVEVDFIAQGKALVKRMTNNTKKLKEGTEDSTSKLMADLESFFALQAG